jgi:hypothetical protein
MKNDLDISDILAKDKQTSHNLNDSTILFSTQVAQARAALLNTLQELQLSAAVNSTFIFFALSTK